MDLIGLVPSFGGLVWTVIAFVLALSIIVAIHEYGHYIVGRWTGIHAEVFSLGFGPVIYSRIDSRGTRWQIAALPFGGYVKFLGDSDAASGKDGAAMSGLSERERRRTMHGAPLWARVLTVAAGPAFNFVSALLIFTVMVLWTGVATEEASVGKVPALPFEGQTLQPGDTIVELAGQPTPDLATLVTVADALPPSPSVPYVVERAGVRVAFDGPYPFPPLAGGVQPQTAAFAAGLKAGDVIMAVDGAAISAFSELRTLVGESGGRDLRLTVWRAGEVFDATLTPRRMDLPLPEGGFETRWLIGLSGGIGFEPVLRTPGPVEAIGIGARQTWMIATTSLSGLYHMITGAISSCNLRGPIGIAESSGAAASQGVESFVWFIAMLSVAVGLMNLFPIPVLDGGHLVFHAYEAVTGKPPSDRALQVMMMGGLALLLSLMVFALTNDLFCP
ncbi:RIP metalloprotease RseP [Pseudotabrizicola alkalilacus]|uniref:Zinc metalloprotease n=1 Tax=Pseudotabrizicola alkalilacus TaxID=2305252 RepID=A0A411YZ35_9RHOB|nr:RIP metalloprotease RseP [Pseudotabrizicola alkalilacus]RGP36071.1 RIP metalloprotease RseP [Pseudotabrizicola alkalilacus]